MNCTVILVGDGPSRQLTPAEAAAYQGPGFIWSHVESAGDDELPVTLRDDIPDVAAHALVATETRPRCDRIEDGAILNLRGPATIETDDSDRLVLPVSTGATE